jgi:hypothetical protein
MKFFSREVQVLYDAARIQSHLLALIVKKFSGQVVSINTPLPPTVPLALARQLGSCCVVAARAASTGCSTIIITSWQYINSILFAVLVHPRALRCALPELTSGSISVAVASAVVVAAVVAVTVVVEQ